MNPIEVLRQRVAGYKADPANCYDLFADAVLAAMEAMSLYQGDTLQTCNQRYSITEKRLQALEDAKAEDKVCPNCEKLLDENAKLKQRLAQVVEAVKEVQNES